ncbi:MAG: lipoate--protein ligase family protein [Syntrophomonadaceae bacterium]|nr:lipoate--protein ligase family protein [Syntrophomonadaceae bacterium]
MINAWRLLDTGFDDGFTNMAMDEAILTAVSRGLVPPTLRFYGWDPPTITLGYFQKAEEEIDLCAARCLGVQIVRRLTGGRAVLHHRELTYSIIAPADHPNLKGTVLSSYLRLSQGLLAGYRSLGALVELAKGNPGKGGGSACFDTPSWYELTAQGKKIAGSAQTRKLGAVLQHGSLPFYFDIDFLLSCLKLKDKTIKERLRNTLSRQAAGINQILNREIGYNELAQALINGWSETLGWQLHPGTLTAEELLWTDSLLEKKYATDEWNLHRRNCS